MSPQRRVTKLGSGSSFRERILTLARQHRRSARSWCKALRCCQRVADIVDSDFVVQINSLGMKGILSRGGSPQAGVPQNKPYASSRYAYMWVFRYFDKALPCGQGFFAGRGL